MKLRCFTSQGSTSSAQHHYERKSVIASALMALCFTLILLVDFSSPMHGYIIAWTMEVSLVKTIPGAALRGKRRTADCREMDCDEMHSSRRLSESQSMLTPALVGAAIALGLAFCVLRKTMKRNIDDMNEGAKEEEDAEIARQAALQMRWTEEQFAPALSNRAESGPGIWRSLKQAAQKHRLRKAKVSADTHADTAPADSGNGALEKQTDDWVYNVGMKSPTDKAAAEQKPVSKKLVLAESGVWGSFKRSARKFSGKFRNKRSKKEQESSSENGNLGGQTPPSDNQSRTSMQAPEAKPPGAKVLKEDMAHMGMWSSFKQAGRSRVRKLSGKFRKKRSKKEQGPSSEDLGNVTIQRDGIQEQPVSDDPSRTSRTKVRFEVTSPDATPPGAKEDSAWGSFKQASRSRVRKLTGRLAHQAARAVVHMKVHPKRKRSSRDGASHPVEMNSEEGTEDGSQGPRQGANGGSGSPAAMNTPELPRRISTTSSSGLFLPAEQSSKGRLKKASEGRRYSKSLESTSTSTSQSTSTS